MSTLDDNDDAELEPVELDLDDDEPADGEPDEVTLADWDED
jgi:hypothetical protein